MRRFGSTPAPESRRAEFGMPWGAWSGVIKGPDVRGSREAFDFTARPITFAEETR